MENKLKQEEKPLTKRELIAVWLLMIILKVVKPTEYTHEYGDELRTIKELLK